VHYVRILQDSSHHMSQLISKKVSIAQPKRHPKINILYLLIKGSTNLPRQKNIDTLKVQFLRELSCIVQCADSIQVCAIVLATRMLKVGTKV
jgi:hypothetical protein